MQPIDRRVARAWLLKAEPLAVVAETGGWGAVATMERCYQHAHGAAQLEVILNPAQSKQA